MSTRHRLKQCLHQALLGKELAATDALMGLVRIWEELAMSPNLTPTPKPFFRNLRVGKNGASWQLQNCVANSLAEHKSWLIG
jgi:hypothetical protein